MTLTAQQVLQTSPVIPVLSIADASKAADLAQALVNGGVPIVEVTLRTEAALASIAAIRKTCPDALVGAGTIIDPAQIDSAIDHGAQFLISPGLTPELAAAFRGCPVPVIPGVATASEIMHARAAGFHQLKFFPAKASGGPAALRALSAPFADVSFCPTGGISMATMTDYLALPAVNCVGGSWLAPDDAVKQADWNTISTLAKQAIDRASGHD